MRPDQGQVEKVDDRAGKALGFGEPRLVAETVPVLVHGSQ